MIMIMMMTTMMTMMKMMTMMTIITMMTMVTMMTMIMTLAFQAPLVHLEKLLFYSLGLGKLPPVRRIKTE